MRAVVADRAGSSDATCAKALPQRQQVEHQLDQAHRIAAGVAAIGKDLPIELGGQQRHGVIELAVAAGDAQIGLDQGDQRQQARIAVGRAAPSGGQVHDLLVQYAHEGCVRAFAVPVQQQRHATARR
jgi:hypothetical protein